MITWWCPVAGPIASSTSRRYRSSHLARTPGVAATRFVTLRNLIPHLDTVSCLSSRSGREPLPSHGRRARRPAPCLPHHSPPPPGMGWRDRCDLLEQLREVAAILSDHGEDDGADVEVVAECVTRSWRLRDRFSSGDLQVMIDLYGSGRSH